MGSNKQTLPTSSNFQRRGVWVKASYVVPCKFIIEIWCICNGHINYLNMKMYPLIQKGNTEQRKIRNSYFLPPFILLFFFNTCLFILNSMKTLPLSIKEAEMKWIWDSSADRYSYVAERLMLDCNNANSGTTGLVLCQKEYTLDKN